MKTLLQGSCFLYSREENGRLSPDEVSQMLAPPDDSWLPASLTENVHEILLREGKIHDPRLDNRCAELKWIGEKDWIYRYEFQQDFIHHPRLIFQDLDTFVDIYLNGTFLLYHDDMNLPVSIDVPEIHAGDILLLHFYSSEKMLENLQLLERWGGLVDKLNVIRKHKHDFTAFSGQNPYLALVGPFGDILVETWDKAAFGLVDIGSQVKKAEGTVSVSAQIMGMAARGKVKIVGPDGTVVKEEVLTIQQGSVTGLITLSDVKRWYPRGYGEPSLYSVILELWDQEELLDSHQSTIGFCDITIDDNFKIICNGERIRLWGADFTPMDGWTHRWDSERFHKLIDLAENGDMNLIRVWGGGFAYPDALYEECSRRGILVWQDFIHDYSMYPETKEFIQCYLSEAETMIHRLRHFPCILLWCGGNETFLGAQYLHPEDEYMGAELFLQKYRDLCARLDPQRRYWCNSPSGGNYPNDPTQGDTHSYTHDWYVPGIFTPQFVSESNRTVIPSLSSMKKMLPSDELWPEGFQDVWTQKHRAFLPETWKKWMVPASGTEYGMIQNYYDAENPEQMIYKFGAAARDAIRFAVENCRRGKKNTTTGEPFACNGFMLWKLNDSWPSIYCAAIDYYLMPTMVYYTLKEAYQPVLLSFDGVENKDHITLWGVNDSSEAIQGEVRLTVQELETGRMVNTAVLPVFLPAHDSVCFTNLDFLGQLRRTWTLSAELLDQNGVTRASKVQLLDMERRLKFPKAVISVMKKTCGVYEVTTDAYAHCVCLNGVTETGEDLVFSNNYFSLLPGQTKLVHDVWGRDGSVEAYDIYGKDAIASD